MIRCRPPVGCEGKAAPPLAHQVHIAPVALDDPVTSAVRAVAPLSHWNRRLPHYSLPACLPRSPQPLASDPRSSMPLWGPRREIERLRTISRPWLRPQSQEPLTRLRRVPARAPSTRCNSVLPAEFRYRVPVPPFSLPPKPPLCPHPAMLNEIQSVRRGS